MNIGLGIGLLVAICCAMVGGFMIVIDRCFGHRKSDGDETKGVAPNIGDVEIVEADGKYAVRQFGWRDEKRRNELVFYPTECRFTIDGHTDWIEDKPEWFYFDTDGQSWIHAQVVPLDVAKEIAIRLRTRYRNHMNWCAAYDRINKERDRLNESFVKGKVIG